MPDIESTTTTLDSASAAPVAAESTPVAAEASQPATASSVNTVSEATATTTSEGNEFADALRNEMQSYLDSEPVKPEPQTQQNPDETTPEEGNPEEANPSEDEDGYVPQYDANGREMITAVYIEELGREVTLKEFLETQRGFEYYHANAQKLADDARRLNEANQQLNAKRDEIQQKMDEFNAQKNDPMLKIVQLFKGDPELKGAVTNLVKRMRPNGFKNAQGQTRAEERQAQWNALQDKVSRLEAAEAQRNADIAQHQKQTEINNTTAQIQNHVNNRLNELSQMGIKVTNEQLKSIADSYIPMIKTQGYTAEKVAAHFDNYFRLLASQGQQLINNYQQIKRSAPPAPPSGGAAPAITPTPIRGAEDFESTLAARLSQLMVNL